MNIEEIKVRLDNLSKRGFEGFEAKEHFHANTESDIDYLLSIIEQRDNLLVIVDDIVKAMSRPLEKTESGIAKLALMETLVQRYLYYKEHPNVLHEFLQVIRGK